MRGGGTMAHKRATRSIGWNTTADNHVVAARLRRIRELPSRQASFMVYRMRPSARRSSRSWAVARTPERSEGPGAMSCGAPEVAAEPLEVGAVAAIHHDLGVDIEPGYFRDRL
jgi:hypothetical protein